MTKTEIQMFTGLALISIGVLLLKTAVPVLPLILLGIIILVRGARITWKSIQAAKARSDDEICTRCGFIIEENSHICDASDGSEHLFHANCCPECYYTCICGDETYYIHEHDSGRTYLQSMWTERELFVDEPCPNCGRPISIQAHIDRECGLDPLCMLDPEVWHDPKPA